MDFRHTGQFYCAANIAQLPLSDSYILLGVVRQFGFFLGLSFQVCINGHVHMDLSVFRDVRILICNPNRLRPYEKLLLRVISPGNQRLYRPRNLVRRLHTPRPYSAGETPDPIRYLVSSLCHVCIWTIDLVWQRHSLRSPRYSS